MVEDGEHERRCEDCWSMGRDWVWGGSSQAVAWFCYTLTIHRHTPVDISDINNQNNSTTTVTILLINLLKVSFLVNGYYSFEKINIYYVSLLRIIEVLYFKFSQYLYYRKPLEQFKIKSFHVLWLEYFVASWSWAAWTPPWPALVPWAPSATTVTPSPGPGCRSTMMSCPGCTSTRRRLEQEIIVSRIWIWRFNEWRESFSKHLMAWMRDLKRSGFHKSL